MNLRSVDLNLLVILDALLDEAHVSRAATRLGLTQPATSHALARCRQLFDDPLLEKHGGTMRLTARARHLRDQIRDWLRVAARLIDDREVDLGSLRQTVRLVMSDFPAMLVASPLYQRLRLIAPGVDLVLEPWRGARDAFSALADGTIDVAVSFLPPRDPEIRRFFLFEERFQVFMRKGHPAAGGFDIDHWLAHPHLIVSASGGPHGSIDEAIANAGRSRRVGLVVPTFLMAPNLLRESDLIATLPARSIPDDIRKAFATFDPPLPLRGAPIHVAWHRRRDDDVVVRSVADVIRSVLECPDRSMAANAPAHKQAWIEEP